MVAQQQIIAGECRETHSVYQLALNYLRRQSMVPTSSARNEGTSSSQIQREYISWSMIYMNEVVLSKWSISPMEYLQRLPMWILFVRSAYACVQSKIHVLQEQSKTKLRCIGIDKEENTIATVGTEKHCQLSTDLYTSWLSMLVFAKFLSLYPGLENNPSEINLHDWIELASDIPSASLFESAHMFCKYCLREIRRNGMKLFPVSLLVHATSILEDCNRMAIAFCQHRANDTILLEMVTIIRDLFGNSSVLHVMNVILLSNNVFFGYCNL